MWFNVWPASKIKMERNFTISKEKIEHKEFAVAQITIYDSLFS